MKALVYDKTSPDRLSYGDVEKPVPGDGEILISVHTTSLNAADYRLFKVGLGIPKTGYSARHCRYGRVGRQATS